MRRVAITVATLFLAFGGIAQAKTFRVAGIYSDSMTGHFNCTCNQEAACMTLGSGETGSGACAG